MATPSSELSDTALQTTVNIPPKTKEPLRYKCETCAKAFTRSATLKQHVRKHTGEKPYGCGSCPKAFARSKDLKRHEFLHDAERKFVCEGKMNVRGLDLNWGCGKKFARKDGLVAHLKSPENQCLRHSSEDLADSVLKELDCCSVYLRAHGTWTCSFKDPWSSPDEAASSAGCGRKFKGAWLLRKHISSNRMETAKCWTEIVTLCRIEAIRRALGRAVKIPISGERSKKLDSYPIRCKQVNVLNSVVSFGYPGTLLKVKLDARAEVEHLRSSVVHIGGILIADSKMHLESPPCGDPSYDSNFMKPYLLEFTVRSPPHLWQVGGLIRLRGNLEGDLNTISCDSVILGVFMPGDGELVASDDPRRAQLQACMNAKSIPVWHDGVEIARFAGEVSVTREEHNLWVENWWKKWY